MRTRERERDGTGGSQTATAWPSSAGTWACASNSQGVEAPWPLYLAQKDTRGHIKPQKTPRDST